MKLLTNKDGSLKTGRVAGLVFVALLGLASLSFEASKPMDKALVAVKHVFEPQPEKQVQEKQAKKEPVTVAAPAPQPQPQKAEPAKMEVKSLAGKEEVRKTTKNKEPEIAEKAQQQQPDISFDPSGKLAALAASTDSKKQTKEQRQVPTNNNIAQNESSVNKQNPGTADSKQFQSLFHSWRTSGSDEHGQSKMSLKIEGLRQMHELFVMKAVAVQNGKFYDLHDASQLPESSLESYSVTVFQVANPQNKWASELATLSLAGKSDVEVRYYMYTFVRNAIFTRGNVAFSWCVNQGLIAKDTPKTEVEIIGRAHEIRQEGGGKFAVYVPHTLLTAAGQKVKIDPSCFAGQDDIDFLKESEVI